LWNVVLSLFASVTVQKNVRDLAGTIDDAGSKALG
jgi:hypothetical protein